MTDREVLAFDLYGTLVDLIAISGELDRVLGGSGGREVARLWRLKQLEYSFRLTAMGHYEDFRWVMSRALDFAFASTGVSLPGEQARQLTGLYDELPPFPDAVPALRALAGLGYELAVFSNGSPAMISNCLGTSGLGEFFGQRISADEVRMFKPSPRVYQHAAGRAGRAGQARHLQPVRQRRRERGRDAYRLGERSGVKMRSGTSGVRAVAWRATKAHISATARAPKPIVCADPHPHWPVCTIANTAIISEATSSTAPGKSTSRTAAESPSSGT